MTPDARRAFILAQTRLRPVPLTPELRLHVAEEATPLWQKTEDELGALAMPPPFWAFAWAGGQALARHILDNPGIVRGRRVLDFAAGSGLVGIAALRAGAAGVAAADIDAFALAAMELNAAANGAQALQLIGKDIVDTDGGWDVILAGDICYEKATAERVTAWLAQLAARGAIVLIGDPGRAYLPRDRLTLIANHDVPTTLELEDAEMKRTGVWRFT